MSLEVKNAHRQAFKEIFSMKAVEGKLDKKGLADLFIMIDYKVLYNSFTINTRFHKNSLMKWFREYLERKSKLDLKNF